MIRIVRVCPATGLNLTLLRRMPQQHHRRISAHGLRCFSFCFLREPASTPIIGRSKRRYSRQRATTHVQFLPPIYYSSPGRVQRHGRYFRIHFGRIARTRLKTPQNVPTTIPYCSATVKPECLAATSVANVKPIAAFTGNKGIAPLAARKLHTNQRTRRSAGGPSGLPM